jgi:hypothetical protein
LCSPALPHYVVLSCSPALPQYVVLSCSPTLPKLDLNLRKNPVKCYIWSAAVCGVQIWTLRKVDQCGAGEGWRRSVRPIV